MLFFESWRYDSCDSLFSSWRKFEHPPEYSEDFLEEAFDLFLSETIPVVDKPTIPSLVGPDQQGLEQLHHEAPPTLDVYPVPVGASVGER